MSLSRKYSTYEGHPLQGLFEAQRVKKFSQNFILVPIRRGGASPGAAAFIMPGESCLFRRKTTMENLIPDGGRDLIF